MAFKRHQIDLAYRKLKSYVYYDNFSLVLRQQIAEFESGKDFDDRLDNLVKYLNAPVKNKKYFNELLENISCSAVPKSYSRDSFSFGENIISNNFTNSNYLLKKVNYFFEGPIELHLISVLWILHEGYVLHKDYAKDNYAYFLELNPENGKVVDGLRLFKPYFEQYQHWRDKGVDLAKNIVANDTDVVILSLDIQEYYYNIQFHPELRENLYQRIRLGLNTNKLLFSPMIFDIHDAYEKVCPKKTKAVIPIGLLSSGILANWYLGDFDSKVKDELSPAYYGRYVDDILIVLSNTKINKSSSGRSPLDEFFNKFFVERNILKRKENIENAPESIGYSFTENPRIKIQKDKITVYSFESKESQAVLDIFKKKIEQNSSAFWFLPNDTDINDDFDESVYELTYTDTINKLRSVTDIKQSKYGASIFLAKKIKIALLSDSRDEKTTEQILTFFKGIVNLEFSNLWEKVLTYFVIVNDKDAFWKFFKETISSIDKIKAEKKSNIKSGEIKNVKEYLSRYLMNCCALATALNPGFVDSFWWEKKCTYFKYDWFDLNFCKIIFSLKNDYITSNLLRNGFIVVPLLNYLKVTRENRLNLIKYDSLRGIDALTKESLEFDEKKLKYSPRFIYLYEFNSIAFLKNLTLKSKFEEEEYFFEGFHQNFYDISFKYFFRTNYALRNNYDETVPKTKTEKHYTDLKDYYYKIEESYRNCDGTLGYNTFQIPQSKKIFESLKIAVANTRVESSNIEASLFGSPNTNASRRAEFIDILNGAEKVKADILILPEVSVPYRWLPVLADQARRKQRAMIVGLEHLRINNKCYNLLATILPLEHNGIKDVVINLRLKNHYSPHETKVITDRGKSIPKSNISLYNLFVWGGIHFSNYNCYELADINHRALFKSKVDLLFASEYNPDVNYFSNIVETVSRDVHCYFIQANSSDFGDSRITSPSKTEIKDVLRLKGGENSVVLLGKIDIQKLRNFQRTRISGQDTKIFKNTPPDFDHTNVENR